MKTPLLIGTYTSQGSSRGIYEAQWDAKSGGLDGVRLVIPQQEPSYLVLSRDGKRLYAVEETLPAGRVFSYQLTDHCWVQTGCQPSGGSAPCHVMLNEAQDLLAVANYMDGAVSFYDLPGNGALDNKPQTIMLDGRGVHPKRQECAHAHQCVSYGEKVLVCDLGNDKVRVFSRTEKGRFGEEAPLVGARPGAGPRHLVLSADGVMLYLLCELQNVLYAYRKNGGCFVLEGVYEYLAAGQPPTWAGAVRLSPDERFLFASSRGGYDGVALFELDPVTRLPQLRDVCTCGAFPRDILPAGEFLLCACQDQNEVQVMKLDREKKTLLKHGGIAVPKPACLVLG